MKKEHILWALALTLLITNIFLALFANKKINNHIAEEVVETSDSEQEVGIFYYMDSLCYVHGVPVGHIYQIGLNESGWRYPDSIEYVRMCELSNEDSRGDLQINMKYYRGKTDRISLLEQGIKYYRQQYDRYGSWKKARFAYARGNWRPEETWKPIERSFMNKMIY